MTDSVRTPMASAVRARVGERRSDRLGATRPGEAGHMHIEFHLVLRSLRRGWAPRSTRRTGIRQPDPRAAGWNATYAAVDGRHGRRDRRHGGSRAPQSLHHAAVPRVRRCASGRRMRYRCDVVRLRRVGVEDGRPCSDCYGGCPEVAGMVAPSHLGAPGTAKAHSVRHRCIPKRNGELMVRW